MPDADELVTVPFVTPDGGRFGRVTITREQNAWWTRANEKHEGSALLSLLCPSCWGVVLPVGSVRNAARPDGYYCDCPDQRRPERAELLASHGLSELAPVLGWGGGVDPQRMLAER